MKKSAYYSDIFFSFCVASVCFLCLLRYLRVELAIACIFSVLAGICVATVCALALKNKREQGLRKASDERLKEQFLLHLIVLPCPQRTEFLCNLLHSRIHNCFLVNSEGVLIYPIFFLREITPDDILPLLQNDEYSKKKICCAKLSSEAKKFCEQANIDIIDGAQLFQLALTQNALPNQYASEIFFKTKKKERFRLCFSKSNSRRFFVGGTFILLSSLITPFPYYYLIVGFCLMGIAVFTKIFGKD